MKANLNIAFDKNRLEQEGQVERREWKIKFFLEYESAIQMMFIIYCLSTLQNILPIVVVKWWYASLALSLILTKMSNIISHFTEDGTEAQICLVYCLRTCCLEGGGWALRSGLSTLLTCALSALLPEGSSGGSCRFIRRTPGKGRSLWCKSRVIMTLLDPRELRGRIEREDPFAVGKGD